MTVNSLDGLKSQILTMSLMKGDSISSMIYSFLLVTVIEYIFSFIPLVKTFIESKLDAYFKKASENISLASPLSLQDKPKEKTASINFSRIYESEDPSSSKGSIVYETADCLLEIMTQLDSCKHVVCDKFFYVNHHETVEISPKIYIQVTKLERNKNMLVQIKFELFSYDYTLTELQEYINKTVKAARIKRQNRLGNQLYYFNEIVESLPVSNGKVMYSRAQPNVAFSMTPFFTNKNLYNMYGENFQVVSKRVNFFINNEDWYRKKGIPYTLGILIHGPPGSGKTSCIKAIANSTKRHIVNISLNDNITKTQLQNLFYNNDLVINKSTVNENITIPCDKRVYVIEDIDCLSDVVLDRKYKKVEKEVVKNGSNPFGNELSSISEDADEKLTLSFLLNLFDGVLETPGRILIMSSNYPERIDKALIRPGRVDLNIEFGHCSIQTIKQIINFIYEIPLSELNYEFADNVYTPAKVNQLLFNNIDNKEKGIESLLQCNYVPPSPTLTPREEQFVTTIFNKVEDEVDVEVKKDNIKTSSPRGTTSLDDIFGSTEEYIIGVNEKKEILKREATVDEEQRIQDIINDDKIASTEEVLRVYTKMKNAYDKGLGQKLYSEEYLKGVMEGIDSVIKFESSRKGYSVGRIKTIEQELDREIKEYGFEVYPIVKEEVNLKDVLSKLSVAFENKDIETINSLQKYVPTEGYSGWRVADAFSVKNFLEKKQKALINGLASYLYDSEYQAEAACFDIQNKLNDNIGIHMYMEKKFKEMEKELDEQIKKYNIVIE